MFGNSQKSDLKLSDFDVPEVLQIYDSKGIIAGTVKIMPSVSNINGIASVTLKLDSLKFNDEITITEDGNVKSKKYGIIRNWFMLTAREFVQRYYASMEYYIDYDLYNVIDKCSDKLVEYSGHELVERENLKAIIYRIVSAQDNPLVPKRNIRQNLVKVDKILNKYANFPNNCSLAKALELMHKDIYN